MSRNHVRGILVALFAIGVLTAAALGVSSADPSSDGSYFDVEITETGAAPAEGETFVVNATITNTGTATDRQQIHLKNFDGEVVDSVAGPPVTLAPGEHENVTLRWETELGEEGSGEFSVQSNDEYPRQSMTIEKGAFFEIAIDETNLPISDGERLNVTANITTPRETIETTRVRLELDGERRDDKRAVLMHGEMDQVTFSINNSDLTAGESTLAVATEGDRDSMRITIDEETSSISAAPASDEAEAERSTNPSMSGTVTPTAMSDSSSDDGSSDSESSDSEPSDSTRSQSPDGDPSSTAEPEHPSGNLLGGFSSGRLIAILVLISAGAGVIYSVRTR